MIKLLIFISVFISCITVICIDEDTDRAAALIISEWLLTLIIFCCLFSILFSCGVIK